MKKRERKAGRKYFQRVNSSGAEADNHMRMTISAPQIVLHQPEQGGHMAGPVRGWGKPRRTPHGLASFPMLFNDVST